LVSTKRESKKEQRSQDAHESCAIGRNQPANVSKASEVAALNRKLLKKLACRQSCDKIDHERILLPHHRSTITIDEWI